MNWSEILPGLDWLTETLQGVSYEQYQNVMGLLVFVLTSVLLINVLSRWVQRTLKKRRDEHFAQVTSRVLSGLLYLFLFIIFLDELKIDLLDLAPVLGAAGIISLAIGLAAQSGLSNVISGLFLLLEKPFRVGDMITVEGRLGTVHSIDLLSVKLRTLDNVFVRVPNKDILEKRVENVTRFPIRRLDLYLEFAYREEPRKIFKVLEDVARNNLVALEEPDPLIFFYGIERDRMKILFGIWFEKNLWVEASNSVLCDLKDALAQEGIEMPVQRISIHEGPEFAVVPSSLETEEKTMAQPVAPSAPTEWRGPDKPF